MSHSQRPFRKRWPVADLATGEGPVINNSRLLYGLHRAGHIFPMVLHVRARPASEGPPAFMGLMRPTAAAEDGQLFLDSKGGVTAASDSSMAVLNISASSLAAGATSGVASPRFGVGAAGSTLLAITEWVPEWQVCTAQCRFLALLSVLLLLIIMVDVRSGARSGVRCRPSSSACCSRAGPRCASTTSTALACTVMGPMTSPSP